MALKPTAHLLVLCGHDHVCRLSHIYYKNYMLIQTVRSATYCCLCTCSPPTILQKSVWPFAAKRSETHGLHVHNISYSWQCLQGNVWIVVLEWKSVIGINKISLYITLWTSKVTCNQNNEINCNIHSKNGRKNNFQDISN